MIHTAAPEKVNGSALRAELAAAGVKMDDGVILSGRNLHFPGVNESDRETVEQVVADHVPPDPPPNPDEELRQTIEASAPLEDLKAALMGGPGRSARAAARRPT